MSLLRRFGYITVLLALIIPISSCSKGTPGATYLSDPLTARNKFIDIVRQARLDKVVELSITPDTIEVVFRKGDQDSYWTDSGDIHEVASHYAKPSGLLSASSIDVVELIKSEKTVNSCDSGVPKIIARASFASETLVSSVCITEDSDWPQVRKVTLGDQQINDIDLFSKSGVESLLQESVRLLPDQAITSIVVSQPDTSTENTNATASISGIPQTLGNGRECSPTFVRAEKLGADSIEIWSGIDMYSCQDTSETTPFKVEKVSAEQVFKALSTGMEMLNVDRKQVQAWTLSRLKWSKNQLAVYVETSNGSCYIDMDGKIVPEN